MRWDAVNARARGLATHLLDQGAYAALTKAADWPGFLALLTARGLLTGAEAGPEALDRAVSRMAADRLALLGRWLGPGAPVLAVVLEVVDLQNLRALLRGAAQGASPAARLRLTVPSRALPERALARLAGATSVPDLIQALTRLGHPAARRLDLALRGTPESGLRTLEWELARLFAERVTRLARAGGHVVRQYAADQVDELNAWTLLLAAGAPAPLATGWIGGGRLLTREVFDRLRRETKLEHLLPAMRAALADGPIGAALTGESIDLASVEARVAETRLATLRRVARRDPLGPAVTLLVLERIRAEARALRGVAWAVSLAAPPTELARLMPGAA